MISSGIHGFHHQGLPLTQLKPQQQPEYAPVPSMQVAGQIRGQLSDTIQLLPQCYANTQQQQSCLPHPSGDQSKGMHTEGRSESLLLFVVTAVY